MINMCRFSDESSTADTRYMRDVMMIDDMRSIFRKLDCVLLFLVKDLSFLSGLKKFELVEK